MVYLNKQDALIGGTNGKIVQIEPWYERACNKKASGRIARDFPTIKCKFYRKSRHVEHDCYAKMRMEKEKEPMAQAQCQG